MPARVITPDLYEALLSAFREQPGVLSHAQRKCGVGYDFAKRAWEVGWLPRHPFARPIKDVLEEEKIKLRAEARRAEEAARRQGDEERQKARQDALAAMAQEGRILALARADVQGALGSASLMLPALRVMAERAAQEIMKDPGQFSPQSATKLLREYSFAVRALATAGEQIIRAERLHKGEPTDILGVSTSPEEMSLEDAVRTIKETSSLYELAKRQGLVQDPEPEGASSGANGANGHRGPNGETIN